jgi:hypothetical protein
VAWRRLTRPRAAQRNRRKNARTSPTSDAVYHNLAITEDQKVPGFGRLIVYDMMPCAT